MSRIASLDRGFLDVVLRDVGRDRWVSRLASSFGGATLDLEDGAALALVVFEADVEVLGSVLVSEPQPDSMIAAE